MTCQFSNVKKLNPYELLGVGGPKHDIIRCKQQQLIIAVVLYFEKILLQLPNIIQHFMFPQMYKAFP